MADYATEDDWLKQLHFELEEKVKSREAEIASLQTKCDELESAITACVDDAKAGCGGDGLGCEAFRGYYDTPQQRWRKCGQCPMDAVSDLMDLLNNG